MPRKAYVADLQRAVDGVDIAGISNIQCGGDDGEFTFHCVTHGGRLEISALIPDVSEYPSTHSYMIFAPQDAPAAVAGSLADISDNASGKTITQMLELVSHRLGTIDRDGDREMLDSDEIYEEDEEYIDDDYDVSDEGEEYFPDDEIAAKPILNTTGGSPSTDFPQSTPALRQKIRYDLRVAKEMGFKVGHVGNLLQSGNCYVSLSCRIAKLGISQEAMKAWHVEPSEYFVVILHYPCGYKSMESILAIRDAATARRYLRVRIGVSTTYRPTAQEALDAFTILAKEKEKRRDHVSETESNSSAGHRKGFRNCFVSRPLNELFDERFYSLLRIRYQHDKIRWDGAEEWFNQTLGVLATEATSIKKFLKMDVSADYPSIVTSDHIHSTSAADHSLPLVAIQFALRHFVRCTEFCLICFTRLPNDIQALKPYVCDNPLCLYQYMSLGFGPSIEHEIVSQPKVVDLLISFCYASAKQGTLKDFPCGLGLMVPPLEGCDAIANTTPGPSAFHPLSVPTPTAPIPTPDKTAPFVEPIYTTLNVYTHELIFADKKERCPVRTGQWIVLKETKDRGPNGIRAMHCRVEDITYWPTVKLGKIVYPKDPYVHSDDPSAPKKTQPPPPPGFHPATFYIYDRNFDDLGENQKNQVICALLAILPTMEEMRDYLAQSAQSPLTSWVDRLPPAVLGILRWIIASNRACIMQVDDDDSNGEERLHGMPGWSQFRFAMGAPDKERRFAKAVRDTSKRLSLHYPTLFAWHGSPLGNWHSIIREGLHFKHTAHGRAYGHGVYHAPDINTSLGYTGGGVGSHWPGSELKISMALALNEIVNAPAEFVSHSPHLVVQHLDWIQTRYLFVSHEPYARSYTGIAAKTAKVEEQKPKDCIAQDPSRTPRGVNNSPLIIPTAAVATSRHTVQPSEAVKQGRTKLRKTSKGSKYDPIKIDGDDEDDNNSVATLEEDRAIFDSDDDLEILDDDALPTTSGHGTSVVRSLLSKFKSSKSPPKSSTGFVPGSLDFSKLPMLNPPSWASPQTTRRLMKDFQALVKSQEQKKPDESFFFVDSERIENMYQWIVELHNFDPDLPLTKDMKKRDVKSIVLELRFGNDYPISPPFVRVIKPRFRAFMRGGGGHVTLGGAMCMELLTNDGWSAILTIENVLLQVFMAMSSTEPAARLEETRYGQEYGVAEAIEAYIRACNTHGWRVPAGFRKMALGGADES